MESKKNEKNFAFESEGLSMILHLPLFSKEVLSVTFRSRSDCSPRLDRFPE